MLRPKILLPLYILLFTFIGGFADASSFLLSGIFTGHLTGNLVLCAVYGVQGSYFLLFHCICAVIGFTSGTMLGVWFRIEKKTKLPYKTALALIFQLGVFFVIGASTGALCIYLMDFVGFSVLGLLLICSITLSIYIQHRHII